MGRIISIIMACATGIISGEALADGSGPAPHRPRFEAWGGLFLTRTDTRFQVNSDSLGEGTPLDGEEDLGLPRDGTAIRLGAALRFGDQRRHVIEASYFTLDRDAESSLQSTIQFGEETITASAAVTSRFAADIFRLHYIFMVLSGERHEAGIALGAHVSDVDVALEAPDLAIDEDAGALVPLPTAGLRAQLHVMPRIKLRGSTDLFYLVGDHYRGVLWDHYAGVDIDITGNVGLGLGYNQVHVDAESDTNSYSGFLDMTYGGLLATIRVMM